MEIVTKKIVCDSCKKIRPTMKIKYPVLFTTEQTEGRAVEPYISYNELDMCKECIRINVGITATGAMGYNEYKTIHHNSIIWNDFKIK